MRWAAECAVVIPCLNEQGAIGSVVAAVRQQLAAVFVIDDGSLDDTGLVAEAAGATVIRHAVPQGKGAALQAGWRAVQQHGFKWVLTMDGDGQHSPEDIPNFLRCAERTGAGLVVGNRMFNPGKMPALRRVVNWWMSREISRAAGQELPDTQCGFRLMNLDCWAAMQIATTNFEIESEVLLAFARARQKIMFVPVRAIYESEQSKIHPLRDTIRWFRWWRRANRFGLAGESR